MKTLKKWLRIIGLLSILIPLTVYAHHLTSFSGGSVTELINASSSGTHTIKTGGANIKLDAGAGTIELASGLTGTVTGTYTLGGTPTISSNLILTTGNDIRPTSNSTTAINIAQADGTDFVTFDTTNKRVGIGTTAPAVRTLLHVFSNVNIINQIRMQNINAGTEAQAGISLASADGEEGGLGLTGQSYTTGTWDVQDAMYLQAAPSAAGGLSLVARATIGGVIRFYTGGDTERARITESGNVKIAGTATRATTEGNNHLDIADGTAPVGTGSGFISLYSTSGELRVMDSGGTATLLSASDKTILANLNPAWMPWAFAKENPYTGERWEARMGELIAWAEALSGKKFTTLVAIPKLSWAIDAKKNADEKREHLIQAEIGKEIEVLDVAAAIESRETKVPGLEAEKTIFELDKVNKRIVSKIVKVRLSKPSGKFESELKDGHRFDETAGKIFRKKTRAEAETVVPAVAPVAPPKWMVDRGVTP